MVSKTESYDSYRIPLLTTMVEIRNNRQKRL